MASTVLSTAAKSAAGRDSRVGRAVNSLPWIPTNVSSTERWLSLGAGALMTAVGLRGHGATRLAALAGGYLLYRAATGYCPGYHALGVSMSDATADQSVIAAGHGSRVDESVVVNKPVTEVYDFWRDFENLPRFMTHLLDVNASVGGRSHWVARGPFGMEVEWEAEIITERRPEVIAWRSLPGADVDNTGSVHFRELPNGDTEVRVSLKYDPPGGKVGSVLSRLVGKNPQAQVRADLQRFKEIMESAPSGPVVVQHQGAR
jgi:uncharacterized membrane protein